MKKKFSVSIPLVLIVSFALMSLSPAHNDRARNSAAALMAPIWKGFYRLKISSMGAGVFLGLHGAPQVDEKEIQRLSLENELLKNELKQLKKQANGSLDSLGQVQAFTAKVIYRSPATWDNCLWIDAGTQTNGEMHSTVIAKNSPVLQGTSVIGVVDYVGEKQSRVRLITDPELCIAVRAVRVQRHGERRLAKGEVHGVASFRGRMNEFILHGNGFNYDFADAEGPARDLRTGQPVDNEKGAAIPLVMGGDLLVTSGLDGVFPAGLRVAKISKIFPLKEGDYYYELEAKPTAENLEDLSFVYVLNPLSSDL